MERKPIISNIITFSKYDLGSCDGFGMDINREVFDNLSKREKMDLICELECQASELWQNLVSKEKD